MRLMLLLKQVKIMMTESEDPILEFDDAVTAKLNPANFAEKPFGANKMVITFFPEAMDKPETEGEISLAQTIGGENVVYVYRFANSDVLITPGAVGCPSCGGVLDRDIAAGQILAAEGAIRDEGFSYHFV